MTEKGWKYWNKQREVSPPFLHKSQLESWSKYPLTNLSRRRSVNETPDEWPLASPESLKDSPYRMRMKIKYESTNFSWNLHNKNYASVKAPNLIGWVPKSIPLQFSAIIALSACSRRKTKSAKIMVPLVQVNMVNATNSTSRKKSLNSLMMHV